MCDILNEYLEQEDIWLRCIYAMSHPDLIPLFLSEFNDEELADFFKYVRIKLHYYAKEKCFHVFFKFTKYRKEKYDSGGVCIGSVEFDNNVKIENGHIYVMKEREIPVKDFLDELVEGKYIKRNLDPNARLPRELENKIYGL